MFGSMRVGITSVPGEKETKEGVTGKVTAFISHF